MANSDNVMRGGLTPKYVNVEELLAICGLHSRLSWLDHSRRGVPRGVALSNARAGVRALAHRGSAARRASSRHQPSGASCW